MVDGRGGWAATARMLGRAAVDLADWHWPRDGSGHAPGKDVIMTDSDRLDTLLAGRRVIVILRGFDPDQTVARAQAAWAAGIGLVEVTIGDAGAIPALQAAVAAGREQGRVVGAGTVLTPTAAAAAAEAGAAFTIAPGFDIRVLAASHAAGLPHLPGVATPTEVHHAVAAGCRWLKVFPAASLQPAWFSAIRGPFPTVRLVATGGVTAATARSFLDAGASAIGVGSAAGDELAALAALER